jgi:hypothetical protein
MQLTCSIGFLTFVAAMVLADSCRTASQEDPFIELETNAQGVHTYVRRDEIEALTDVSPAHCVLLLTSGTSFPQSKNVRACQTCASIIAKLQRNDFVSFQADFGNTYISPQGIDTMAWTSNSRCRISLKSGKFVYAKESCNEVHKAMPRE